MSKRSRIRFFSGLFTIWSLAVFTTVMIIVTPMLSFGKGSKEDGRWGWWWYEDPPAQDKSQKGEKEPKTDRVLPSMKDYTPETLWNMHPDDFQPLAKEFLKKAVQTPTVENVRDFYTMVDISRMKAHVFQNVAGVVWQKYPDLSLNADLPNAQIGRDAKLRISLIETENKLRSSASDFALIYFYSENCEFCKSQDAVLDKFYRKYGWEIKRVEIHEHPDLAERFDIKITPHLMLIYRESSDYFPVAIGVSSIDEIEDRIYRGMRLLSGEVSPESFTMYDFQKGGKLDPTGYMRSESDDNRQ